MKPSLSQSRVEEILRSGVGEIRGLHRLAEGEESQAFGFAHGAVNLVARFNPSRRGFDKDDFAYRKFRSPSLPVPEILLVSEPEPGLYLCVSSRAPGETLQDLEPASLPGMVGPVGRVMEAIAAADVSPIAGFGPWDAEGRGDAESWAEFLTSIADRSRHDWVRAGRYVDMREVDPLLGRVHEFSNYCPEARQLVHGDFGSNNVIEHQGRITAVIDWSESLAGDALYDVANVFFWRTWLPCMEAQAQFFEQASRGEPGTRERLLCYQLRIGLQEVYENAVSARPERAAWALNRCRQILS
jgi:hygromycin-B 4-O-kinase